MHIAAEESGSGDYDRDRFLPKSMHCRRVCTSQSAGTGWGSYVNEPMNKLSGQEIRQRHVARRCIRNDSAFTVGSGDGWDKT